MAAFLSPITVVLQAFTNIGVVLSGGKITTYEAGTTTLQTTYTDATMTVANSNPIILDSAGRLATEVWVPEGKTQKMVLANSAGVVLATLDNLALINDTTAFLDDLGDPSPGQGADLVANAVKSYDTFNSLRASPEPVLAAGETKIVILEGGVSINDGLGGAFYWSASSAAADNGKTVIKLSASAGSGRFLRITWNADTGLDDTLALQSLGWRDLPQNIQNANYSLQLSDRGKQVYHFSGTNTWTIPQTGTGAGQVNWPAGAAVNLVLDGGQIFLIVTTDALKWYPNGSLGTRTLIAPCDCVIKKISAGGWNIVGVGVT